MYKNMKIWALLRKKQAIICDTVMEFSLEGEDSWPEIIGELSKKLLQGRPVILSKHIDQLARFKRTMFLPADFLEPVHFDAMELEIFPEDTKK